MDPALISMLVAVGSGIAAGGAAYGGVRYGLNGMREAVKRIETKLDALDNRVDENALNIARLQSFGYLRRYGERDYRDQEYDR